jgi:Pentapeptide repeats (8 copies)
VSSEQESSTRGLVGRCAGAKDRPVLELWRANLSGADLQDANLRQAYLQATTLNGANLTSPPFLSARSVRLRGLGILRIVTKVLVGVTILGGTKKILWAQAMNPEMWQSPATKWDVETLKSWAHRFVIPAEGLMAPAEEEPRGGRSRRVPRSRRLWRKRRVQARPEE